MLSVWTSDSSQLLISPCCIYSWLMTTTTFTCLFFLSLSFSLRLPKTSTPWSSFSPCFLTEAETESRLGTDTLHCSGPQLLEHLASFEGPFLNFSQWHCQKFKITVYLTKLRVKINLSKRKLKAQTLCILWEQQTVGSSKMTFIRNFRVSLPF